LTNTNFLSPKRQKNYIVEVMTHTSKKPAWRKNLTKNLPTLIFTFGSLLILVAIMALVIFNQQTSQEIRSQAAGSQPLGDCNKVCSNNNDCAVNFRCYHNVCRLAINPDDDTCNPNLPTPTHTPMPTPTLIITPTSNLTVTSSPSITPTLVASDSANESESSSGATISPTLPPNQPPTTPDSGQPPASIINQLVSIIKNPQYRLPVVMFGVGLVLILVALLIRTRQKKAQTPKPKQTPSPKATSSKTKPKASTHQSSSSMTQRLKVKQVKPPT